MLTVVCLPNRTNGGRRASSYAAWLAGALGAPLITDLSSSSTLNTEMIFVTHLPLADAVHACPRGAHLLMPLQEDGHRQAKRHGNICLPFGSRDMHSTAVSVAFTFAKQLGVAIIATHTTYRKEGVEGDRPEQHTSAGALAKAAAIRTAAEKEGVQLSIHLQMVNEIPDFVIAEAVKTDCGLIIMSRGEVVYGSNADRVAVRTHLPILITAETKARNS